MFRAMTTSQVERKSFQEVGWIHGYVLFFVCGPSAAPQDPGCNWLCLSSVCRQSDTWLPGTAAAFALFVFPSFFIHSASLSDSVISDLCSGRTARVTTAPLEERPKTLKRCRLTQIVLLILVPLRISSCRRKSWSSLTCFCVSAVV